MANRRKRRATYLAQVSVIAVAAVMLIVAAVLWIALSGNGGVAPDVTSSNNGALLSNGSPAGPGQDEPSSQEPVSSTVSISDVSGPVEDNRFTNAPGPDSEGDGVKRCYLTFDDGPSTKNTPKILDILDRYNVKATFFVVGGSNLSAIKDAYDRGHAIGLHANVHEYNVVYASVDAYFKDLETIGNKVKDIIGFTPNIIRFPGGSSNTVSRKYCKGIMKTLTREVQDRGYYYFDWNVDSTDASGNGVAVEKLVSSVKNSFSSSTKNICVLMHDTDAKNTTVEALPQIIEYIQSQGFEFCILNKYAYPFHHGVNN